MYFFIFTISSILALSFGSPTDITDRYTTSSVKTIKASENTTKESLKTADSLGSVAVYVTLGDKTINETVVVFIDSENSTTNESLSKSTEDFPIGTAKLVTIEASDMKASSLASEKSSDSTQTLIIANSKGMESVKPVVNETSPQSALSGVEEKHSDSSPILSKEAASGSTEYMSSSVKTIKTSENTTNESLKTADSLGSVAVNVTLGDKPLNETIVVFIDSENSTTNESLSKSSEGLPIGTALNSVSPVVKTELSSIKLPAIETSGQKSSSFVNEKGSDSTQTPIIANSKGMESVNETSPHSALSGVEEKHSDPQWKEAKLGSTPSVTHEVRSESINTQLSGQKNNSSVVRARRQVKDKEISGELKTNFE